MKAQQEPVTFSLCSHSTKIRTFFFSTAQCLHLKEKPRDTCRTGDKPVVWTHLHQEDQESPPRPVGFDSCLQIQHLVRLTYLCETYHITIKRGSTGLKSRSHLSLHYFPPFSSSTPVSNLHICTKWDYKDGELAALQTDICRVTCHPMFPPRISFFLSQ